jgi:hypothetical protein
MNSARFSSACRISEGMVVLLKAFCRERTRFSWYWSLRSCQQETNAAWKSSFA